MGSNRFKSVQRTNEYSPAPLVLGLREESLPRARGTGDREVGEERRTKILSSAVRTRVRKTNPYPAMNRWAIFDRPLRGRCRPMIESPRLCLLKFKIPSPLL